MVMATNQLSFNDDRSALSVRWTSTGPRVRAMPMFVHEEMIEPLGLTVTDAAKVVGVSRPNLSLLLNEKIALSAEMALRIKKAFGPKMPI